MTDVLYFGSTTSIHSGACQWMFRLAKGMQERGYDCVAVLPDDTGIAEWYDEADIQRKTWYSEPLRLRRSIWGQFVFCCLTLLATIRLAAYVRRENIDVVHVNEIVYPQGLVAGKLGGAKTVCHVRAGLDSRFLRFILGWFSYLLSDKVVCVSERTRHRLFHQMGIDSSDVSVIYDGVPSPERFDDADSEFRDEVGIPHCTTLVVMVSKLTAEKGQDRLLAAANLLSDQDIHIAVVGGAVTGHEEYADELRSKAEQLERVHLTGFYPDVAPVFEAADIAVHVPRYEDPFPGVVLEAMLAGTPVIGTHEGGIPEQIVDGETGLLIPSDAHHGMIAEAICKLATDEKLRTRLGHVAAEQVRKRFPVNAHFDEVELIYTELSS